MVSQVRYTFEFCGIRSYLYYWFNLIEIKQSNSIGTCFIGRQNTFKWILIIYFIAVCIYRYVITLGLWNKYDIDGHHS